MEQTHRHVYISRPSKQKLHKLQSLTLRSLLFFLLGFFLGGLNAWVYLDSRLGGTAGVPLCHTSSASGGGCWNLMYAAAQKESHSHMEKKKKKERQDDFSDSWLVPFGCPCGSLQEPKSLQIRFLLCSESCSMTEVLVEPREHRNSRKSLLAEEIFNTFIYFY